MREEVLRSKNVRAAVASFTALTHFCAGLGISPLLLARADEVIE